MRKFIGIPFVDGGRDPAVGLDCWGLFMVVQRELGNEVPDFDVSCFDTKSIDRLHRHHATAFGGWQRIEEPEVGCGIAMSVDGRMPGCIQHFGVYIGDGKFIHTLKKVHSCISSVRDSYWKTRIRGYYRWTG